MNSPLSQDEYRKLYEKYAAALDPTETPEEFFKRAMNQGVGKGAACFLLRDLYGFNLAQCLALLESHAPQTDVNQRNSQ